MLAEAPRPLFGGPSWEAPVLRIHCIYGVILLRRRLKTGPRQEDQREAAACFDKVLGELKISIEELNWVIFIFLSASNAS